MSNDELDLVETEDLLDALGRRYETVLLVAAVDAKNDPGASVMRAAYRGGFPAALGLATYALVEMSRGKPDGDGEEES